MSYKVIKIKKANYDFLVREAATIQYETGKKTSFDDTITKLRRNKNEELLKFAGSWKDMGEKEASEFEKKLRKGWANWKA